MGQINYKNSGEKRMKCKHKYIRAIAGAIFCSHCGKILKDAGEKLK